jgi:type I restriction enzyme S subunit
VDKKIEQLTEKHRLLTEYKKGVMQQIFSQQIRFKDDNGNDYPEWEVKHLGDIANITMGTSPSSSAYNEAGTGLPLIQGNADVKNRISTPRIYTSEITKECLIGDVLLSVRAPVGEVSRSLHHACIGRGMSSIRGAKLNSTEFIYQFLLWFEPRWKSISQGSTFESVNTKDIKELSVLAPCEEEQQKIANFLTEIDHKIDQAWSNLEQTKTFKKGLLQKMFV